MNLSDVRSYAPLLYFDLSVIDFTGTARATKAIGPGEGPPSLETVVAMMR